MAGIQGVQVGVVLLVINLAPQLDTSFRGRL